MNCTTCQHPARQHSNLAGCLYEFGGMYCECKALTLKPLAEPAPRVAHDGATYDADRDAKPLNGQQQAVYTLMADGRFRTLAEIAQALGYPEASVSARLRDLRKSKWGGHTVERRHREGRLYEYALVTP